MYLKITHLCSTKALIRKFTSLPSAVLNNSTVDSKISSYYNVHNYTLFYVKLQSEPDDQLNSAIFWQKKEIKTLLKFEGTAKVCMNCYFYN